jgi:hypothetical protein
LVVPEVTHFSTKHLCHHCVISMCWESDCNCLDACVRSVCLLRIDDAVFWSRRHLSLSLSLAENLSKTLILLASSSLLLQKQPSCRTWYVLFQKMTPNTKPFSEVYRIIMNPFLSSTLTSSNPVVWKRGSDLTSSHILAASLTNTTNMYVNKRWVVS